MNGYTENETTRALDRITRDMAVLGESQDAAGKFDAVAAAAQKHTAFVNWKNHREYLTRFYADLKSEPPLDAKPDHELDNRCPRDGCSGTMLFHWPQSGSQGEPCFDRCNVCGFIHTYEESC